MVAHINLKLKLGIFLLVILPFAGYSQTEEATIFDEATIVYKNSVFGGPLIHTNGWGGFIAFGKGKTAFKYRILQFDVVGMKHPKEIKSYNSLEDSRSYIFGKLNSMFVIRPTYGRRIISFDKIRKSGVSVGYSYRFGPSLGFTKPVYLQIAVPDQIRTESVIVEKYDPTTHNESDIIGRAGFLKGFDEIKLHPGITATLAANFEYASERAAIRGIEVGAVVDYYPLEPIEIMAFADNYQWFVNFYVSLQFGKKFNK